MKKLHELITITKFVMKHILELGKIYLWQYFAMNFILVMNNFCDKKIIVIKKKYIL